MASRSAHTATYNAGVMHARIVGTMTIVSLLAAGVALTRQGARMCRGARAPSDADKVATPGGNLVELLRPDPLSSGHRACRC